MFSLSWVHASNPLVIFVVYLTWGDANSSSSRQPSRSGSPAHSATGSKRVKRTISESHGDSVSLSEAAKWFLESAHDERVDAAELLSRLTEALATMYRKWGQSRKLSRADWIVCSVTMSSSVAEEPTDDPNLPHAQSFASVIEAFLAVRGLRKHSVPDHDHFYVRTLVSPSGLPVAHSGGSGSTRLHSESLTGDILDDPKPGSKLRPVFVGRILHAALHDERAAGIEAVNRELQPF